MGKAQSKRSVDITTETKKGAEDEITEKMEKIEDIDKKDVVNGDATIQEKNESEKKDTEDAENDKDMTTEKNADAEASGDSSDQNKSNADDAAKEDGSATAEEISPLADESIKKSKKEKVKKKWSFRSISFGKKDKQKPAKNEEAAEDGAVAVNGAAEEKTSPETEESQPSANAADEKLTDTHENGNATEQELNGEQTEEKLTEEKANEVTANTTNVTTTTETSSPVQNDTAVSTEKTENKAIANNADDEATKSGNGITEEINATEQLATDATESVEAPAENKCILAEVTTESSASTTNGEFDKVHQNGTDADNEVEQPKAQIEVKSNTDNKASAATLDIIPSTSIIPPNVQVQDLNESIEKPDNVVQIDDVVHDKEQNNQKSIDIGVENSVLLQDYSPPSFNEYADKADVDDDNSDKEMEAVVLSSEQPADTERSCDINASDDPSPPPLPISPPPSQVSMFAFTNNEESVEASIQIEKSEPELSSIVDIQVEEVQKDNVAIVPCTTTTTELSTEINAGVIDNDNSISNENDTEEVVVDKMTENKDSDDITDQTDVNQFVHVEAHDCEDVKMSLIKDDDISMTAGDVSEKLNEDESSLAAAVVDEITEKAVEIINQQLKSSEEPLCTELLEQNDEQQLPLDASEEEQTTMGLSSNTEDNETLAHITTVTTTNDTNANLCENANSSQESPILLQTINDTVKDYSLALSDPKTVQQPEDVEMISSNKTDSLDAILEEHLIPTKEFANAKDLKENVAVAEITQDLSVTCE